jgi:hypothetical protein
MVHIGTILEIADDKRYIIYAQVPNLYEKIKCYPLHFLSQPYVGQEIFMFELGKDLYVYIPIRTEENDIRWTHKDHQIKMEESGDLDIKSKKKVKVATKDGVTIQTEGKVIVSNKEASLKDILVNMMMTYIKTETALGGPLTPANVADARQNIQEINKLFS